MNKSDTPETDAAVIYRGRYVRMIGGEWDHSQCGEITEPGREYDLVPGAEWADVVLLPSDFARRLERERDEAREMVRSICSPLHKFVQNSEMFDGTDAGKCVAETIVRYAHEYRTERDNLKETKAALIKSLELLVIASGSCPPTSAMIEALRTVNDTCGDLITRAKEAK